jgi:hypothetical protein
MGDGIWCQPESELDAADADDAGCVADVWDAECDAGEPAAGAVEPLPVLDAAPQAVRTRVAAATSARRKRVEM